jgi:DNA replication protein DnaC
MTTTDLISPDLKTVLRRLKLSPILDTLPERLALARQQQMTHQDFLLLVLSDEASRRDSLATSLRVQRARLDPTMQLELWDATARVTYDHTLWNELVSLRFLERPAHLIIVGPVGVGKTFLAHALGHIACRHATRCSRYAPTRCSRLLSTRGSTTPTRRSCASSSPWTS